MQFCHIIIYIWQIRTHICKILDTFQEEKLKHILINVYSNKILKFPWYYLFSSHMHREHVVSPSAQYSSCITRSHDGTWLPQQQICTGSLWSFIASSVPLKVHPLPVQDITVYTQFSLWDAMLFTFPFQLHLYNNINLYDFTQAHI
jgi:hypothetical protein